MSNKSFLDEFPIGFFKVYIICESNFIYLDIEFSQISLIIIELIAKIDLAAISKLIIKLSWINRQ